MSLCDKYWWYVQAFQELLVQFTHKTEPLSLDIGVGSDVCENISINASQIVFAVTFSLGNVSCTFVEGRKSKLNSVAVTLDTCSDWFHCIIGLPCPCIMELALYTFACLRWVSTGPRELVVSFCPYMPIVGWLSHRWLQSLALCLETPQVQQCRICSPVRLSADRLCPVCSSCTVGRGDVTVGLVVKFSLTC